MGSCCGTPKTHTDVKRCAQNEYPRNPAYANQAPATYGPGMVLPPAGNMGNFMTGSGGGGGGMADGMVAGYMLGQHGGMGMLAGVDGGPRMALGGTYVGLT